MYIVVEEKQTNKQTKRRQSKLYLIYEYTDLYSVVLSYFTDVVHVKAMLSIYLKVVKKLLSVVTK